MVKDTCSVCEGEASQRCGGCRQTYYCSKVHQKLDWIKHKHHCRPFLICEDEVLGRHLVATRDIRSGEVVLRESPLVQGPSQVTGPVCLGCLQGISQHNSEPCELCGWPLCRRPSCRQASQHTPECQWTIDKRKNKVKISQFVSPHPTYECVTALRLCHMKAHSPGQWARLSQLQSHTTQRKTTQKYADDTKSVAQFLRRFYNIEDEFSEDDIMDIWGIIQVNGHEVPVTQPPHVAVYDLASMLEHSCHPNCSKSFTSSGALVIRAIRRIPQGSHINISYTDCLWGTVNRQFHLQDTKFFTCKCARCLDSTELGTYYSALICEKSDCGGTVLPESLCSLTLDSAWTCAKCHHTVSDSQVESLLHQAGEELSTLSHKQVDESLLFLDKWKSKFHRNHYYVTEVKLALAQRLGQETQDVKHLSDEHLQLKTVFSRQILELLSVIAPAEVRVLGVLHFELHACLAERTRRDVAAGDSAQLQCSLMESRSCLEKTIFLLACEPDVLPEGKLLAQAKVNKTELDKTLQSVYTWTNGIPTM